MCVGDLGAEETLCERGVCAGREVTRGSGPDLRGTEHPLEVLVAMETDSWANWPRKYRGCRDNVQGEPESEVHIRLQSEDSGCSCRRWAVGDREDLQARSP